MAMCRLAVPILACGLRDSTPVVGVDVVAQRDDDVGHGPYRDRVQLTLRALAFDDRTIRERPSRSSRCRWAYVPYAVSYAVILKAATICVANAFG